MAFNPILVELTALKFMKYVFWVFSLLIFSSFSAQAGGENFPMGGRAAGLSNATVSLSGLWAVHHNQAGLARLERPVAGLYYENRYLVKELGLKGGAVAIPVKSGVFGLVVSSFGYSQYSENKYGIAYSRQLSPGFSMGIQLDYLTTQFAETYENKGVLAGEIGMQAKVNEDWTIGAHLFNPTRSKLDNIEDERVPTILRIGMDYKFSENVMVVVETEKDIDHKAVVKAGLEYHIVEILYLRAGVSTNPFSNSFGFGLMLKDFNLDVATSYHNVLGYSPQVSLSYTLR